MRRVGEREASLFSEYFIWWDSIRICVSVAKSSHRLNILRANCLVVKENCVEWEQPPLEAIPIFGIVGIQTLPSGVTYLITIKERGFIGLLGTSPIYRIEDELLGEDKEAEELFRAVLGSREFYFSYRLDITNSLQKKHSPSYLYHLPLFERAEEKFFWNKQLVSKFIYLKLDRWVIPLVRGSITTAVVLDGGVPVECTLISRRSRHRSGLAATTRGADKQGNTANFVEIEQIFYHSSTWYSYVTVRGTVPLIWSLPSASIKRTCASINFEETPTISNQAMAKHFQELRKNYKDVLCLNLLDETTFEEKLSTLFLESVNGMKSDYVKIVTFNYNLVTQSNPHNYLTCLNLLKDPLDAFGFTQVKENGMLVTKQIGILRVNCLDSLERTNVIQSLVARYIGMKQLGLLGSNNLAPPAPNDERPDSPLERTMKEMWLNCGDTISRQYLGSLPLKVVGETIRMGKNQNSKGCMFKDGYHNLCKYYTNHYKDDKRQLAVDLLLAKNDEIIAPPTDDPRPACIRYLFALTDEMSLMLQLHQNVKHLSKRTQDGRDRDLILTNKNLHLFKSRSTGVQKVKTYPLQSLSGIQVGKLVRYNDRFALQLCWKSLDIIICLSSFDYSKEEVTSLTSLLSTIYKRTFSSELEITDGIIQVLSPPNSTTQQNRSWSRGINLEPIQFPSTIQHLPSNLAETRRMSLKEPNTITQPSSITESSSTSGNSTGSGIGAGVGTEGGTGVGTDSGGISGEVDEAPTGEPEVKNKRETPRKRLALGIRTISLTSESPNLISNNSTNSIPSEESNITTLGFKPSRTPNQTPRSTDDRQIFRLSRASTRSPRVDEKERQPSMEELPNIRSSIRKT
eukprot:TRINITY_DN12414_c0_g1_i1.p1 TRINITY_DN12414_c0_g1~~TRINITY_DN12414_c0_g1_i1.p1  ORF type:complete len:854 (-),score=156.36 TRINITY_DN12414_c0_g1_i1:181-2742(-)